jgi:hypothetical protein
MNVLKSIMLGGCLAALTLGGSNQLLAQGRMDPAQFRQMRVDRAREQLEIKDDTEWKALEPLVGKVVDAERDVMSVRMGGMGFGRGRRGGSDTNSASARPNRPSFFGEPSAASTALQKAIDDKAPTADLKAKIAAVRADIKAKEAKLDAAQEELRGVLTTRQEAIAVANGLLK